MRDRVWVYEFDQTRTRVGRGVRQLTVTEEYIWECMGIRTGRVIRATDVIETLDELMTDGEAPKHPRSANGAEFTAGAVREWFEGVGVKTFYIELGSPWENGNVEGFNGKLRDELLNREVFCTPLDVQALTEHYRQTYNRIRPHSSMGYRPPRLELILPEGQDQQTETRRLLWPSYSGWKISWNLQNGRRRGQNFLRILHIKDDDLPMGYTVDINGSSSGIGLYHWDQ